MQSPYSNTMGESGATLRPVVRRFRPVVIACLTVRSGVFHHWIQHLWPQWVVPPGFNPLRRGWVYCPAPEAPQKRGMPTGSEAFLELPDACGLWPCDRTHLIKALCHILTPSISIYFFVSFTARGQTNKSISTLNIHLSWNLTTQELSIYISDTGTELTEFLIVMYFQELCTFHMLPSWLGL